MSRFDISSIEAGLNTYIVGKSGNNEFWDEIVSTNDRAIELAREGAPEGVIVIARQQSAGRGRQGRSWVSPKDAGIFVSVVLRPVIDMSSLPLLSFAGGVAAAQAIESVAGLRIGLKWVNDLVYEGKKLGGILAEVPGSEQPAKHSKDGWMLPPAVIIGFGINLCMPTDNLPEELKERVVSLDEINGSPVNANHLASELCNFFEEQYNNLRYNAGEIVLNDWKSWSVTLGKRVKASCGNEKWEGTAIGITESGALLLQTDDGKEQILHAGELSIRLEDGRYA